jgi:sec-independent protein translocase protein TatA
MIEDLLRPQHLLLILGVAILFFGPQKLPELGKEIGRGIRGFKESMKDVNSETAVERTDQHDSTSRPV